MRVFAVDAAEEESLANLSAKIDSARSFFELAFVDDEVSAARSQEDIRYADKIRRSFERLRRAAVKTMEGLFSKGSQGRSDAIKSRRNSVKAIVERCTYVLGDLVTVVSSQIQPIQLLSDNRIDARRGCRPAYTIAGLPLRPCACLSRHRQPYDIRRLF